MKASVLAVGKIKERWMRDGIAEYDKRMMGIIQWDRIEYDEEKMPERPSPAEKSKVLHKEGEKLLRNVSKRDYVILLDTEGQEFSSEELACFLERKRVEGVSRFSFLIGGPYGNGDNLRRRADLKWCLSRLTFTHQMVRLLLAEQVYRAMKIIRNEPYHL